jgi:hypothetical protein
MIKPLLFAIASTVLMTAFLVWFVLRRAREVQEARKRNRTLAPRLALVGNLVMEADTFGTNNPKIVCRIELDEGIDALARNTATMMLVLQIYNRYVEAAATRGAAITRR